MGSTRPILFVDHAQATGGAERSLLMLMERLDRYGWQPHLACPPGTLAVEARDAGVTVHALSLPRLRRSARFAVDWMGEARALARLAREIGAQALYSNTVRATFYSALASVIDRRPLIWHMRDFWLSESRPKREMVDRQVKRLMLALSAGVITNSEAVARGLPRSAKVRIVHNGIDLSKFMAYQDGHDFRSRHNIPANAPVIGVVGRLRPWKGQDRFLNVAAKLATQRDDVYFAVVGGNPLAEDDAFAKRLVQLCQQLSLQDKVRFTGHMADVRPAFAAFDVFVHPGDPEPFGLVNVEAMAMGLPVVAFAHGALPEIVEDGKTGRLVPPNDKIAMAGAIRSLLDDPHLRHVMGRRGRQKAVSQFDVERTARDIAYILQETVTSS